MLLGLFIVCNKILCFLIKKVFWGSVGMEKNIKYNQDQLSVMLILEHNFKHNAVVLRGTLICIMLKFSGLMYLP